MSRIQVNVRRYDGSIVGEESLYSKVDVILRHQEVDSWAVTLPNTSMAEELRQPGAGIVIRRNGTVLVSGPMTAVERTFAENSDYFVISGLSDECYLWDRLIQPGSLEFVDPLWQFPAYDGFSGPAESAMKYYVTNNLLDSSRLVDGTPAITVAADLGRGLEVTEQGRFQMVGDMVKAIGVYSNNMGFSLRDRVFDVYEPQDLTRAAYFSVDSGNVISYGYKFTVPKVTHPYVGGGGELDARFFYLGADVVAATTWGRRIESFVDARDTTDPVVLAQRSQEAITNGASQTSVTMRPLDVPHRTFGVDYNLGDTGNIEGIAATIGQVELTLDQDGEVIVPTASAVATIAAQARFEEFDELRRLSREVNDLHTRV